MSEPKRIGDIMVAIAADPTDDFAKVLRQCPFIQEELLKRKIISIDDLTEWYTPEDIQEKYGMTRVAIRSHVYRNNIPSKKEHGQIYYSKLHFDLSKNSAEESKAEYYTVKEAMEKFKLSRDSVYNI